MESQIGLELSARSSMSNEHMGLGDVYDEITYMSDKFGNVEVKIIDMEFMLRYVFSISKVKPEDTSHGEKSQTSPEIN